MGVIVEIGVTWLDPFPTFDEMTVEAPRLFLEGKKEGRAETTKNNNYAGSDVAIHSLCEQARHHHFQTPV